MTKTPKNKKIKRSPGQTQVSITLSEEMLGRLEIEAKAREQTISGFCRFLFNEYFKAKTPVAPEEFVQPKPKRKANPGRYDPGMAAGETV